MDVVNQKIKILFITGLYLPELVEGFVRNMPNNLLQGACNNYQWAMVKGLADNNASVDVISFPFLPSFPLKYRKIYTPKVSYEVSKEITIKSMCYCTLMGLKSYSIKSLIKKEIRRWIEKTPTEHHVIMVYHTIGYVMEAVAAYKRKYPSLKTCIIIGDVIDYNKDSKDGFLKSILSNKNVRTIRYNYKYFDSFVLMSKLMEEKIDACRGKNIVIEGIWNSTICAEDTLVNIDIHFFNILYSGSLQDFSGILWLCKSLQYVKENIRLYICGSGEELTKIEEISKNDNRIRYIGVLSQSELITLQKKVDLLINPRMANYELTKYSFPSKTIEYMASGTVMAGFRLPGIPDEYYNYMLTFDCTDMVGIASNLDRISQMPKFELERLGQKAQLFIQKNKNPQSQVNRLLNTLQKLF